MRESVLLVRERPRARQMVSKIDGGRTLSKIVRSLSKMLRALLI